MTAEDYDLILKDGLHRFFSFRRAGTADLGLLGVACHRRLRSLTSGAQSTKYPP